MFAVIKTGGKQYVVTPGQKITIEKIIAQPQASVTFEEVLLVNDGSKTIVGTPLVEGAKVIGEVEKQSRSKKKIIFKYKSKTRQRTKKGHRQYQTEVKISDIKSA